MFMGAFLTTLIVCHKKTPHGGFSVRFANCPYRSVPPSSCTDMMSSSTAKISFPFSALSSRNSAKLLDMIINRGLLVWISSTLLIYHKKTPVRELVDGL